MFTKTITAAAFAIGMSTAAFAQATGTGEAMDPAATGAGMPSGWDQTTNDAFFDDSAAGTLRSQDEIQANWGTLTDEQQASVRAHCATYADAGGAGTMTGGATGNLGTTTTGDAGATGDLGTTTTGDAGATGDLGTTTTGDAGATGDLGTTTTGDAGATGDVGTADDTMTGSIDDTAGTAGQTGMTAGGQTAAMSELCDWVETQ